MKKHLSTIGLATLLVASALTSCQRLEMDDLQSDNAVVSDETRASSSFTSIFGIDWSKVTVENSASDYPAFKTMKVTADAKYLYLYFTADPSKMKTGHAYDNVLNVYLYDSSASTNYWQQKAVNVAAMGGWLMKNSQPYFTSWGSGVSSQAVNVNGTYYYEIRYPRSINALLSKTSAHVGLYMNNNYRRTDGSYASSYSKVGIRPNKGSNMYWLRLPSGETPLPEMGSVEFSKKLKDSKGNFVEELSGLSLSKDGSFLWGVGDNGVLYRINFDGSFSVQSNIGWDMEGLCIDPNSGTVYMSCEPNYNCKLNSSMSGISSYWKVSEAANMGNSGIEGIAWHKGNIYLGSQSGATLWEYKVDGTKISKKSLRDVTPTISEIAGLDYDEVSDRLWVIDSNSNKNSSVYLGYTVYVFNGDATKLLKTFYVGDFANWNPESICVDRKNGCVWIADDCGDGNPSILHKVKFTNL